MTESIATQSYLNQSSVFVQGFQQNRFDVLREEIVRESDVVNVFVVLERVYYIN